MKISETLKNYLQNSSKTCDSNIIFTDLEKVRFNAIISDNINFESQNLSHELLSLIEDWKCSNYNRELIMILNAHCVPIINNDETKYFAQMIMPVCHNNSMDGLIIFFRTHRNYIPSSAKSAITIKEFSEQFSDDNFRPTI